MRKAAKAHTSNAWERIIVKAINDGSTPKLTTSANESSCTPSGPDTPNIRATIPSNTSKSAATNTNTPAAPGCPANNSHIPTHPQSRLHKVSRLGTNARRLVFMNANGLSIIKLVEQR